MYHAHPPPSPLAVERARGLPVLGALVDVGGVLVAPVAGVLTADLLSVVLVAVLAPFASLPASFEAYGVGVVVGAGV